MTVGGGVGVDGMEALELAVEGAGDARSVVEPEEAYAMAELVQESGQTNEGRRMMRDARERLSRGHPPLWLICVQTE